MALARKGQIDFTNDGAHLIYGAQVSADASIVADPVDANKQVLRIGPVTDNADERVQYKAAASRMEVASDEVRIKFEVYLTTYANSDDVRYFLLVSETGADVFDCRIALNPSVGRSFYGVAPFVRTWNVSGGSIIPPSESWTTVEIYYKTATAGMTDGVTKIWVNGTLADDRTHDLVAQFGGFGTRYHPAALASGTGSGYFRRIAWNSVDPHNGDPDADLFDFEVQGAIVGSPDPVSSTSLRQQVWARFDRYLWGWNGTDGVSANFEYDTDPGFGNFFTRTSEIDTNADYTAVGLINLLPKTTYHLRVRWENTTTQTDFGTTDAVSFTTVSAPDDAPTVLKFAHSSCHSIAKIRTPWNTYDHIIAQSPTMFFHCGDFEYLDNPALGFTEIDSVPAGLQLSEALKRYRIAAVSHPFRYLANVAAFVHGWDDHDGPGNDWDGASADPDLMANTEAAYNAWTGATINGLSKGDIPAAFDISNVHYYAFDTYKVRVVHIDSRRFRNDPNILLGATQKAWLLSLIDNCDKPILLLYSGVNFSDMGNAAFDQDQWIGFTTDRNDVIAAINGNDTIRRCYVCTGDRHYPFLNQINDKIIEVCGSAMRQAVSALPDNIQGTVLYDGANDLGLVNGDVVQAFAMLTINETLANPTVTIQGFNGEDGSELFLFEDEIDSGITNNAGGGRSRLRSRQR